MVKTSHPGRTAAQRRALDQIGCGNYSPVMAKSTRDAMLAHGLIEFIGNKTLGGDRLGLITIAEYQMPVSVHYQWCQAVKEEVPDED